MIVDALPYFPALMAPAGEAPGLEAIEPMARSLGDRIAAVMDSRSTLPRWVPRRPGSPSGPKARRKCCSGRRRPTRA